MLPTAAECERAAAAAAASSQQPVWSFYHPHMGEEGLIGYRTPRRILNALARAFPAAFGADAGYKLDGHLCLSDADRRRERDAGGSLLYGEVLPEGVTKLCDPDRLDITRAKVAYDLGMGTGKLCVQIFLQFPHLDSVVGVELAPSRFALAAAALRRLSRERGMALVADDEDRCVLLDTRRRRRTLAFHCGDAFAVLDPASRIAGGDAECAARADVVFLNTDFPPACREPLLALLHAMHGGARAASYSDIRGECAATQRRLLQQGCKSASARRPFPLTQVKCNARSFSDRGGDRYRTSWSPVLGHHFHVWTKGNQHQHQHQHGASPEDIAAAQHARDVAAAAAAGGAGGVSAGVVLTAPASD